MRSDLLATLLSVLLSYKTSHSFLLPSDGVSYVTSAKSSENVLFEAGLVGSQPTSGDDELDTVRVRIWRVLMAESGGEMSLKDLSRAVHEKPTDVKFHLQHVAKQAKTLANKSDEWRERRGIPAQTRTVKLKKRLAGNGKRKELFFRLA